ncbi:MAG: sulfite exporter TauE/SafE family protein [Balneolaceae bacterium]|nr:MAG: sulfite exporter TauE/SafE family protein [Balneolaceae bacterium]
MQRSALKLFIPVALAALAIWIFYMSWSSSWFLFRDNWFMTATMLFGSFIAGASSEGGGAIAYPVMTLIFSIEPDIARNFSFAIQSIGMTFAAFWIVLSKIRIDLTYFILAGTGGLVGIIFGTFFVAPLVLPEYAKMMFVSFWLSFGIALWIVTFVNERKHRDSLPRLSAAQKAELLLVGVFGGVFSSVLGNGLDICSFSYVVIKYGLSEKVATPTSVMLMASNAIAGLILNTWVVQTMQPEAIQYWLVSIPVVIFGAPLGAYVITRIGRKTIAGILISIIIIQFVTALFIVRPGSELSLFSFLIFLAGIILFFVLTKSGQSSRTE